MLAKSYAGIIERKVMTLRFTHTDGDGRILVRYEDDAGESVFDCSLSKDEALTALADLATSISDEYGKFNSYSYPGCKAKK